MKEKTFTLHPKTLPFFLIFCFMFCSALGSAQTSAKVPGPISQLTLDSNGKIACEIHAQDAATMEHYTLGTSKAGLTSNGVQKTSLKSKKSPTGAQIFVDYYNFDPNFPFEDFVEAATAFQAAVDAWASSLSSDVPIYVAAAFQPLGSGVLGSAGTTYIYANNPGLERDTWYGNALADKLSGEDLTPGEYDIVARFSTVFPNWYYGTDGNTPGGMYDFKSVVLHELGHGLGFFGSLFVDNNTGIADYGFGIATPDFYPSIYDRLANSPDGKSILKENKYGNYTTDLGDLLLSGPLTAKGPNIKGATQGKGAQVFTVLDSNVFGDIPGLTDIWLPGSSYSHLDFLTYAGGPDGLMVPFLSTGVSFDGPGSLVLAIFDDLGWNGKVTSEVMEENGNNGNGANNGDVVADNVISLYPNPFVSSINVSLTSGAIKKAELTDTSGFTYKVPKSRINGQEQAVLDLSGVNGNSGLYFLKLTYDDNSSQIVKLYKM
ncbi:T9SS type A sorting domain-containing protein [Flagellimonas crocea]|uniref:T9SS type A sorting domain-containing protein n=1 Tax=Flagellimonas crocea TaxID=3067311 RepID=UPI00296FCA72|nr:T9SS type A sorting domain-containing protein [Muricauda sp. DH64]